MKKRIRFIIYFIAILLMHFIGALILVVSPREATVSDVENRMLAAFPSLTAENVFSGGFASEFESYLSDRFPLRYTWTEAANKCMNAFSLLNEEQQIRLTNLDETAFSDKESELEELPDDPGLEDDELDDPLLGSEVMDPEESDTSSDEEEATVQSINHVIETELSTDSPTPILTPTPSQELPEPSTPVETPVPSPSRVSPASSPTPFSTPDETVVTALKKEFYKIEQEGKRDLSTTSVDLVGKDGSITSVYTYPNWRIRQCANVVNRLTMLLPEGGHLYFTYVPRAQFFKQYYLDLDKYVDFRSGVEDYIAPYLNEKVEVFSTAEILEPHVRAGEHVFFNTDHHWTLLGAWYVHQAIIESQGLKAVPFDDNGWEPGGTFRGSLTQQRNPLVKQDEVDTIEIISPAMPYDFYTLTYMNKLTPRELYERSKKGYAGYLGSNRGPWRLIRSYENNGRKMLLLADSMGNAIAPFLLSYYDEIHYMCPKGKQSYDPITAGGRIKDFIDTYGIDDIYIVSTNFIGSESYRYYLNLYMGD